MLKSQYKMGNCTVSCLTFSWILLTLVVIIGAEEAQADAIHSGPLEGLTRCLPSPSHCHCHWHQVQGGGVSTGSANGIPSIKTRRYDIADLGYPNYFHGWVDVQGQGAANDYCRVIGAGAITRLACALAGTHGQGETTYESAWDFALGHPNTWYMKDEDGDGRDDYCRCLGEDPRRSQVVCTKAGERGFYGSKQEGGSSKSFTPTGNVDCKTRTVFQEFGRVGGFVLQ